MNAILDHLDQVSVFGRSPVALVLILGLDWAFTAVHGYEEWRGEKVPLWRIFGAVVGVWLPNWIGFFLFTVVLTLLLWSVGLAGIAGWLPFIGHLTSAITVGALAAVVGARISDTIVSHWGLYSLGYRPNPGLKSTPLYVLEAALILLTFWKGFSLASHAAGWGFACGAGFFIPGAPGPRRLASNHSPLATCSLESMGAPPRVDNRLARRHCDEWGIGQRTSTKRQNAFKRIIYSHATKSLTLSLMHMVAITGTLARISPYPFDFGPYIENGSAARRARSRRG